MSLLAIPGGDQVMDAVPGWVWLRHLKTAAYASALAPPEKPAWMFPVTDTRPTRGGLFRIEHAAAKEGAGWYLFSNHTGGYVNCVEGGLIRGHGYFPRNNEAATREPSTEFDLLALDEAQVRASVVEAPEEQPEEPSRRSWTSQLPRRRIRRPRNETSASLSPAEAPSRGVGGVGDLGHSSLPRAVAAPGPPGELPTKECKSLCRWPYNEAGGGYPTPAFSGALGDFLCPSMFRDLSDYVFKWPFSHFKEKVATAPHREAAKCLPPVPIIYAHGGTQVCFHGGLRCGTPPTLEHSSFVASCACAVEITEILIDVAWIVYYKSTILRPLHRAVISLTPTFFCDFFLASAGLPSSSLLSLSYPLLRGVLWNGAGRLCAGHTSWSRARVIGRFQKASRYGAEHMP